MARHRGIYKPDHPEPYEVSRSQIQSFMNCPACFWMNRVKGIKFPGMPGFLLNTATDTLLKKDFDKYRELQKTHPFMKRHGLGHLVPYKHDNFETWTKALVLGLRTFHEPSGFLIGGGLDDVWHDPIKDELFIVDYKSTAGKRNKEMNGLEPMSLFGAYKEAYKRQMDMYQWIMRQNGFNVSNTGYFLYVNGDQHFEDGMLVEDEDKALMKFEVELLAHESNDSWVDNKIMELKDCLHQETCPLHAKSGVEAKGDKQCEYATLFDGMKDNALI